MSKFIFVANQTALDLVNTEIVQDTRRVDLLADVSDFADWLERAGTVNREEAARLRALQGAKATRIMGAVRELRSALRSVAEAASSGHKVPTHAVTIVNRWLAEFDEKLQLQPSGTQLILQRVEPEFSPMQVLGRLAKVAADLLLKGDLSRVHKCGNPDCILFFYDVSKNHSRQWCSMSACGNRSKVAEFYRRHPRRSRGLSR